MHETNDLNEDIAPGLLEATTLCEKLSENLMCEESLLVEKSHEMIDTLEASVEAIGGKIQDSSTEHFRAVEELENQFYDAVLALATSLLDRMATDDGDDDDMLSSECRAILNDRYDKTLCYFVIFMCVLEIH